MAKYAVKNADFLGDAVYAMLSEAGFDDVSGYNDGGDIILVNTAKKTFKLSDDAKGRTVLDPATSWATVAALVTDTTGGSQATAPAPVITGFAVGDQVTAVNLRSTKAKFRLQEGHVYTVDRITTKGNIGLVGLPNDEYISKRFTKAAATTATSATTPVDAAGNALAVGDTVLVLTANPGRRDGKFTLPENGVQTITEITAKGNIGFGGDDQYKPGRFQKVTLDAANGNVGTGDLVVAAARRDGRFALPENTALTFRGVSVDKGNFILEGFEADTYSPKRFQKVTKVGSVA